MPTTYEKLLEDFLEEEVKDNEFLGFFGLVKDKCTLAEGESLRIDLQGKTASLPSGAKAFNIQLQVNKNAVKYFAELVRTSRTGTQKFDKSSPTLATILVAVDVDPEKISEELMKSYWYEVMRPINQNTLNKGIVEVNGEFTKLVDPNKKDKEKDDNEGPSKKKKPGNKR